MAFGLTRKDLEEWKEKALCGEIAFLTHFWHDPRFPQFRSVTKAACCDVEKLKTWGGRHGLRPEYIHYRSDFPHFDLMGEKQLEIMKKENRLHEISRFLK
ncbi:hypothetical protein ACFFJY_10740 [Fictibacillus aquaticus]|uniref:Uncharacterized protein n=1 Tax=Fictibacillus aquaticus TaxID=2021314 RepID=A0A235FBX7_9BACL|nr:hypothetical protein [Fictibacillus aquaticus]OYD58732.1 hypothetical protein CGZ90_02185 [Fictibacillus aquaticus]